MFGFLKRDTSTKAAAEAAETKSSAAGRVAAWGSAGHVRWMSRDTASLTRNGFVANPVGFRAVKMIAEAVAALPVICEGDATPYDTHPVLRLLNHPNPNQGRAELLETLVVQLMLSGDGYLEAVADDAGSPVELHVLRSDRMSVVPGRDGWPIGYDYTVGGRKHRFSQTPDHAPICHIKHVNPQDDHYGLSPIHAAAVAIDVHNSASRWSKALLDNAARPSGALVYSGADGQGHLAPDQYDRLVMEMETQHQGARNAGRPMLLEGGLDWKPMGFSPSDMEFHKTKDAASRDIAIAFGIPPMLLGIPGDATYANYQEANRAFYRLTVLPLAQRVLSAMAHWLSDLSGDEVALRPDLDQVPALTPERDAHWKRILSADFLSEREKRHLLGLPAPEVCDG